MWANLHTCIRIISYLLIIKSKSKLWNPSIYIINYFLWHRIFYQSPFRCLTNMSDGSTYAVNFPSFALPTFSVHSIFLWIYLSSDLSSRSCMKWLLQILCVKNPPICFDWTSTSSLMFFPAVIWNWPSIPILKTRISIPVLVTHLHSHFRKNKSKKDIFMAKSNFVKERLCPPVLNSIFVPW